LKGFHLTGIAACLLFISSCDLLLTNWDDSTTDPSFLWGDNKYVKSVTEGSYVTGKDLTYCDSTLTASIIPTLTFDQRTVWPPRFTALANSLLEQAKNPGLGVRSLHAKGITGKGVSIAIIDAEMNIGHADFERNIAKYKIFGDSMFSGNNISGPQVLSLLAGKSTGVAPDLTIYFAETNPAARDGKSIADALHWIISENSQLPESKKIRAVLFTQSPSPEDPFYVYNRGLLDSALSEIKLAGITTFYYSYNGKRITSNCYYDIQNPDSLERCNSAYFMWELNYPNFDTTRICIPVSKRTVLDEYSMGLYDFLYSGSGEVGWAIPYLTGIITLGWQIRPELTGEELMSLVFSSAYRKKGGKIINPVAFINSVTSYQR
jgi:hypothetical protein